MPLWVTINIINAVAKTPHITMDLIPDIIWFFTPFNLNDLTQVSIIAAIKTTNATYIK